MTCAPEHLCSDHDSNIDITAVKHDDASPVQLVFRLNTMFPAVTRLSLSKISTNFSLSCCARTILDIVSGQDRLTVGACHHNCYMQCSTEHLVCMQAALQLLLSPFSKPNCWYSCHVCFC